MTRKIYFKFGSSLVSQKCYNVHAIAEAKHTTYSWNIKWQKCGGISGLWVLNEINQKNYPENMKKIVGAVWELPAK